MTIDIKVPTLPESITEATVATWYKKPGEFIKRDEHLVDIETDKVVLEVVAPNDGIVESILKPQGSTVKAEEVIGLFKEGAEKEVTGKEGKEVSKEKEPKEKESKEKEPKEKEPQKEPQKETTSSKETKNKEEKVLFKEQETPKEQGSPKQQEPSKEKEATLSPAIRRLLGEHDIDPNQIRGSGEQGKITKEDVEKFIVEKEKKFNAMKAVSSSSEANQTTEAKQQTDRSRLEKRVPMTRLRARIAERLVEAQNTAAILTTFNEINMSPVMTLRQKYKDTFEKTYGVKLGFMSFFTLAVIEALKQFPVINASIEGHDIIYHGYYDIGIAVSSPRGLVVPIVRDADLLSMAEIEKTIADLSNKARSGQLSIEEITGGTFTITNGGVFGSLMSTPILNPPQSGILGMHKIQDCPIVENGQIVVRPMMYVALSYDHRIIDGSESVRFLVTVKELLEDPARLALKI